MKITRLVRLVVMLLCCLMGSQVWAAPPVTFMTPTGAMKTVRTNHTATLLQDGKVLITGGFNGTTVLDSAEVYDPATGQFTYTTGTMTSPRWYHTANLLPNGQVLIIGGNDGGGTLDLCELYDPATGTFSVADTMSDARQIHCSILLNNGQVLAIGGYSNGDYYERAELYDPNTDTWSVTGSMLRKRIWATASMLNDGRVLVVGGYGGTGYNPISEVYNPNTGTFSDTGSLASQRYVHAASTLLDGKVLVTGGYAYGQYPLAVELYNPALGTFSTPTSLTTKRDWHTSTLLPNGKVLIVGGNNLNNHAGPIAASELYDPSIPAFGTTDNLNQARFYHTATALRNGLVLIAGGSTNDTTALATAELYNPQDPLPAGLSYANSPVTYLKGLAISANAPTSTGGAVASYAVSPALSAGLSLDASTGAITGTPTAAKAQTAYTVTALNATGSTTATVTITVIGITAQPANVSGYEGQSNAFNVVATGTPTSYQWQRSDNGGVLWTNVSTGTGGTTANYVTAPTTPADNGAQFRVIVTYPQGSETSQVATLTVAYITITSPLPLNTYVSYLGTTTLSPTAVGNPAGLTYQWFKQPIGGVYAPIAGATGAAYALPAVTAADHLARYYVQVSNGVVTVNTSATQLRVTDNPGFTVHPLDATRNVGDTATFAVTAIGDPAPTYQWQRSTNGGASYTNVTTGTGATTNTYTTAVIVGGDNLVKYRAAATNIYGTVFSNPATLSVVPKITLQPGNVTVGQGTTATFRVTASGSGALLYAWRKNGTPIGGATASTYVTPAASLADDASTYTCLVTDGFGGSALSAAGTLTVNPGVMGLTGSMGTARRYHTATLLPDGKVLVVGGFNGTVSLATAELYDPGLGTFSPTTGNLGTARFSHTATLLTAGPNAGKVLITGGATAGTTYVTSAELYDPATKTFSPTANTLRKGRMFHVATLLPTGNVLLSGGYPNYATAEIYNQATGLFVSVGSMTNGRRSHSAIVLQNGLVLIAGGFNGGTRTYPAAAELYNPATGTFTVTGSLNTGRYLHTGDLLSDGRVLIAGGYNSPNSLASAEIYDPNTGSFSYTGSLATARNAQSSILLTNGKVLVNGGTRTTPLNTSEIFDPTGGTWTPTGIMATTRSDQTATLLLNGKVLIAGGYSGSVLSSAEIFDPQ